MLRQLYHVATARVLVVDTYAIVASVAQHRPSSPSFRSGTHWARSRSSASASSVRTRVVTQRMARRCGCTRATTSCSRAANPPARSPRHSARARPCRDRTVPAGGPPARPGPADATRRRSSRRTPPAGRTSPSSRRPSDSTAHHRRRARRSPQRGGGGRPPVVKLHPLMYGASTRRSTRPRLLHAGDAAGGGPVHHRLLLRPVRGRRSSTCRRTSSRPIWTSSSRRATSISTIGVICPAPSPERSTSSSRRSPPRQATREQSTAFARRWVQVPGADASSRR